MWGPVEKLIYGVGVLKDILWHFTLQRKNYCWNLYPQLTNLDGLYFVNSNCLENSFRVENKNKMSGIFYCMPNAHDCQDSCQYSFDFGNEQKVHQYCLCILFPIDKVVSWCRSSCIYIFETNNQGQTLMTQKSKSRINK